MTTAVVEVRITRYREQHSQHVGANGGLCESLSHGDDVPATCFACFGAGGSGLMIDLCDACADNLARSAVLL